MSTTAATVDTQDTWDGNCVCARVYLISEFADEFGVVVVRLDERRLAAGHLGGALDEVGPQGALGQEDLLWLQVHLPNHLVGYLHTQNMSSKIILYIRELISGYILDSRMSPTLKTMQNTQRQTEDKWEFEDMI